MTDRLFHHPSVYPLQAAVEYRERTRCDLLTALRRLRLHRYPISRGQWMMAKQRSIGVDG
jgi:hypothetical protein